MKEKKDKKIRERKNRKEDESAMLRRNLQGCRDCVIVAVLKHGATRDVLGCQGVEPRETPRDWPSQCVSSRFTDGGYIEIQALRSHWIWYWVCGVQECEEMR